MLGQNLKDVAYLGKQKGTQILYQENAANEIVIVGDRAGLRAALTNILDNAIRYSPRGKVEVSLKSEAGKMTLVVKDNGIAIKADDFPHIFDRFYRGKNAILLEPSETGVGLYITKKIVELHKGTIDLASKEGQGTTVTVTLPLKVI